MKPDLTTTFAGITMANPLVTASGCFGYGKEAEGLWDFSLLGALTTKSISLSPWMGAPTPRITETPLGILNAIGLQNPGVDAFLSDILPHLRSYSIPLIVNIVEHTEEGFAKLAKRLDQEDGIAAIEVNASCPNYAEGNIPFSATPEAAASLTRAVAKHTSLPIIVKLSPNVTDITAIARACEESGADALSLINTLIGMKIDTRTRKPVLGFRTGGLSGPAVKPVAIRMVYQTAQTVRIPILGMGGIMTGEDVVEFLLAGATAVGIGTAHFADPWAVPRIRNEVIQWMEREGVRSLGEIRGAALP